MSTELKSQKILPSFFDTRQDTVVAWLGMAGALINARGTILFIDPLITVVESNGQRVCKSGSRVCESGPRVCESGPRVCESGPRVCESGPRVCESGHRLKISLPLEAEDVPRVDAVLYTHADGDHFGRLTAETFAARLCPRFLAPPPVQHMLWDMGIDEERIVVARDSESTRIGHVNVVVTPALHDWQKENPWQKGDCCGYLVQTPDGTIWHPGDTRLIDELLEVRGVDVFFFDVAAVDAHLGPAGSARLAETCGAQAMIAYHYGTFDLPPGTFGSCDPRDSLPYVKGLSARFLQLSPGEPLRLPLETSIA